MKEWKPGDPVAQGAFILRPEHAAAYHEQVDTERMYGLAAAMLRMPPEQAAETARGIESKRGRSTVLRLREIARELKATQGQR